MNILEIIGATYTSALLVMAAWGLWHSFKAAVRLWWRTGRTQ